MIGSYKPGVPFSYWRFDRKCIFQDGCRRHPAFPINATIPLLMNQSPPNLIGMLRIRHGTQLSCQNSYIPKFKMAAAAFLNFQKLLPFLDYLFDLHQIYIERSCFNKSPDGGCRYLKFRKIVAISHQSAPKFVGMLQIFYSTHCFVEKSTFNKSQDGCCRRLEFRKTVAISLIFNRSSPNLMGILQIQYRT